jgi:hypothetical protein
LKRAFVLLFRHLHHYGTRSRRKTMATPPSAKSISSDEYAKEVEPTIVAHHSDNEKAGEIPTTKTEAVLEEIKRDTAMHEGEDDIAYPSAWKLAVIIIALCLAIFCMALDNTMYVAKSPSKYRSGLTPRPRCAWREMHSSLDPSAHTAKQHRYRHS